MTVEFIPAIDLLGGKCVRLFQGDYNQKTDYSDSPLEMARHFVRQGAQRIHLVDLDGAKRGSPVNQPIVREMAHTFAEITFEIGGGIRTPADVANYLELGVNKVILGSQAVQDVQFLLSMDESYPERIILGLDAKGDYIATHGWQNTSTWTVQNFLNLLRPEKRSLEIIFTDISTDGTLEGPPLDKLKELAGEYPEHKFIASGGISSLTDVQKVLDLEAKNITGIISGKAIYENQIHVQEAVQLCRSG